MTSFLALITLMAWPVIPLFWIPVHLFTRFFRKIKLLTYIMPLITWLPVACLIYLYRDLLLHFKIAFPVIIRAAGVILLAAGTGLHVWTGKLLSLRGLIGLPEVYENMHGRFVAAGAFSIVRHPTYLAHTMMFTGVFFATGVISVGVITVVDFSVVNLIIIPLEERELLNRFGEEYRDYRSKVPKFFPRKSSGVK
ncbi:MAG: isoprenylcysteine carboxylmethyltransferase family protein [Nitrospirae bacterium]|nr:isoprenylcysteine carboxylmethyltransferase family protein [Nitrospirota bacterium]